MFNELKLHSDSVVVQLFTVKKIQCRHLTDRTVYLTLNCHPVYTKLQEVECIHISLENNVV